MTKVVKCLFCALLLSAVFIPKAVAATITAASCSQNDVANAVGQAAAGDTVVIPACPAGVAWTSNLTVTKGITVQGHGIGQTVLIDNVPKGSDPTCAGASPMLTFNVAFPNKFRLTGLTIQGGVADPQICNPGHVVLAGTSQAFRVDHVSFVNQQTGGIRTFGALIGVIDHCQFQGDHKDAVIVGHGEWAGKAFGDGSWAAPTNLGSPQFVFIEDCTFVDLNAIGAGAFDGLDGARVVFRHNTALFFASHGTESGGRRRGIRAFEIYNNTFTTTGLAFTAIFLRGGTGVIYNNIFTGPYTAIILADNFRDPQPYDPWGQCNGTSAFDQNLGGQTGYSCLDQVGRGVGNLISGDSPTPAAWPNQALEPVYQWGNTFNGPSNPTMATNSNHIQANRDYIDNVVKPGYTAFPYPHPLTLGLNPPAPPANVRVIIK